MPSQWRIIAATAAIMWLAHNVFVYVFQNWILPSSRFDLSVYERVVLNPSVFSIIGCILVSVVLTPICEELFFRGFLYSSIRARHGVGIGMVMSAGLFALIHPYGWKELTSVFVDGLLFACAFELTGSLLPGIVLHGVINFFSYVTALILYNPVF